MLTEVLLIRPLFAPHQTRPASPSRMVTGALPRSPYATSRAPASPNLLSFEPILVDHHTDAAPAAIGKAANHSSAAVHLHIGFRAHNISRKRNRKINCGTNRYIRIHAEQDSVGGYVLSLDDLSRRCRLVDRRL